MSPSKRSKVVDDDDDGVILFQIYYLVKHLIKTTMVPNL